MKKSHYLAALVFSCLSFVATAADFKDGVDFKTLKEAVPATSTDSTVGVSSIFWYGCPHCYNLSQMQEQSWLKTLPKDVDFHELPVIFGKPWQAHAQLFYAMEELGYMPAAQNVIFDAVQNKKQRLDDEDEIVAFVQEKFGIKPDDFRKAYRSFGVRKQTQQANTITRGAQLTGVPAIIVDGRFLVDPSMAGSLDRMLAVTDYLVEQVRSEKQQTAPEAPVESAAPTSTSTAAAEAAQ